METPSPELAVAEKFAKMVKSYHPHKWLAYNMSPSFNWSAFNFTDEDIKKFSDNMGKLGYVFQFITLAGFHLNALKSEKLAREMAKDKMYAYVNMV